MSRLRPADRLPLVDRIAQSVSGVSFTEIQQTLDDSNPRRTKGHNLPTARLAGPLPLYRMRDTNSEESLQLLNCITTQFDSNRRFTGRDVERIRLIL